MWNHWKGGGGSGCKPCRSCSIPSDSAPDYAFYWSSQIPQTIYKMDHRNPWDVLHSVYAVPTTITTV